MAKTPAFPVLSTKRLRLRAFEARDADGLHRCLGDAHAMRYWNLPASAALEETAKLITNWLGKTSSPYEHLAWAVTRQADDACIGMICYHHRETRHRKLEIGYCIAPKQQRKGYASEAVMAVLDHCHGALGVHRIEAFVHVDNIASKRTLERLGFRCEGGPLRDYWCVGGEFASVMVYALLTSPASG